jgi:hypothetical protein
MTITAKFTIVEYGQNSQLSQLSEGDCLKCDVRKLSPLMSLDCMVNEMMKLLAHSQNINEVAFSRKYGRLLKL